jgi:hypothetical protein
MASAWIGEGSSKPISSIAFPTSFHKLKSENWIREFISQHHLVYELIRWRTETTPPGHIPFFIPGYQNPL